jgi:hypothetical protein
MMPLLPPREPTRERRHHTGPHPNRARVRRPICRTPRQPVPAPSPGSQQRRRPPRSGQTTHHAPEPPARRRPHAFPTAAACTVSRGCPCRAPPFTTSTAATWHKPSHAACLRPLLALAAGPTAWAALPTLFGPRSQLRHWAHSPRAAAAPAAEAAMAPEPHPLEPHLQEPLPLLLGRRRSCTAEHRRTGGAASLHQTALCPRRVFSQRWGCNKPLFSALGPLPPR